MDLIVADRTGTVTRNAPMVAQLAIGDEVYGRAMVVGSLKSDSRLLKEINGFNEADDSEVMMAVLCLALAHCARMTETKVEAEFAEDRAILECLRALRFSVVASERKPFREIRRSYSEIAGQTERDCMRLRCFGH
jgi:magnesium-transporting ATPase (P-type)